MISPRAFAPPSAISYPKIWIASGRRTFRGRRCVRNRYATKKISFSSVTLEKTAFVDATDMHRHGTLPGAGLTEMVLRSGENSAAPTPHREIAARAVCCLRTVAHPATSRMSKTCAIRYKNGAVSGSRLLRGSRLPARGTIASPRTAGLEALQPSPAGFADFIEHLRVGATR